MMLSGKRLRIVFKVATPAVNQSILEGQAESKIYLSVSYSETSFVNQSLFRIHSVSGFFLQPKVEETRGVTNAKVIISLLKLSHAQNSDM